MNKTDLKEIIKECYTEVLEEINLTPKMSKKLQEFTEELNKEMERQGVSKKDRYDVDTKFIDAVGLLMRVKGKGK